MLLKLFLKNNKNNISLNKQIQQNFGFTYPCPRKLREIVQLSLFERESKERCAEIWNEYHGQKFQNTSMCIASTEFKEVSQKLKTAPMFLWPIKNESGGHFMVVSQYQNNSILYTYLEDYKQFGVNASPYFVLTFFEELVSKKSIAMLRGDIIDYQVNKNQAIILTRQTMDSYLLPSFYDAYIHPFNHNQTAFNYNAYCNAFKIQVQ